MGTVNDNHPVSQKNEALLPLYFFGVTTSTENRSDLSQREDDTRRSILQCFDV